MRVFAFFSVIFTLIGIFVSFAGTEAGGGIFFIGAALFWMTAIVATKFSQEKKPQ